MLLDAYCKDLASKQNILWKTAKSLEQTVPLSVCLADWSILISLRAFYVRLIDLRETRK